MWTLALITAVSGIVMLVSVFVGVLCMDVSDTIAGVCYVLNRIALVVFVVAGISLVVVVLGAHLALGWR